MSDWVFDLGNTRLKCAALRDRKLAQVHALPTGAGMAAALEPLLPEAGASACLASVASASLSLELVELLSTRFKRLSIVRSTVQCVDVRSGYAEPRRLGVDRLLAMVAARRRGPGPWLVAGVGTALTIDVVDAQGQHRGGSISPSPTLMRAALHGAAAQLPVEGGRLRVFADNTPDALATGCEGAALGLIERSLREAGELLGEVPALLLHGGGGEALATHLAQSQYAPWLVLDGVARWALQGSRDAGAPMTVAPGVGAAANDRIAGC